jgi:hypothetical protein
MAILAGSTIATGFMQKSVTISESALADVANAFKRLRRVHLASE